MNKNDHEPIEIDPGSGNVFADMGLEDADELFTRTQLGFHIYLILKDRGLKQREIASILGINQPEVSLLMNGRFQRFTTDKLLDFLNRLDQKVTIRISRRKTGRAFSANPRRTLIVKISAQPLEIRRPFLKPGPFNQSQTA